MSSSMYTTAEGVLVVTHVHPFPHGAPQGAGLPHCVGVQKFSKNHPTVLGTIQIMVGLIVLLFGIAMAIPADTIAAFSGLWVWGTLVYITAGSLTVAAGRYLTRSLVNAALAFCVIAAVFSTTGTILYSLDAAGLIPQCYGENDQYTCYIYQGRMAGFSGVLAIANLLELIVSIVVAGIACNATCNCSGEPRSVIVIPAALGLPEVPAAAPPVSQVQNNSKDSQQPRATGEPEPPTYDSVIS
ncbi:membrane-spanning 4-domains subfamily A member 4A-like isoform X1 [Hippoglossus hippoglossus]|uniref:membrane-spanning 4-domains subfamily A member 4A-like isoform X1 n=1 Tax=Hippoglossus hippoglossus TaxID=8267 RepID=UPI00148DB244|nr:membrane-spanning 4-domains subfamily A member 4A-like isoform X1 [Hippoglossus hippoglossus]